MLLMPVVLLSDILLPAIIRRWVHADK